MPTFDRPNHTKLVATVGPASRDESTLRTMLATGVDVCRLNFSHGTPDDHGAVLASIRRVAAELAQPVAVMGDLCGPKIRLGPFSEPVRVETGQAVELRRGEGPCEPTRWTTSYAALLDEVRVGQRILIDDGQVRLLVTARGHDACSATVTTGGSVSSRKGVNLPDTRLNVPALTDKDLRDLRWAAENDLDYVALSFVRTPEDVRTLRARLIELGSPAGVVTKIEKFEALEHLDELIELSDAVLVARGDLGVEMDVWQVPLVQKSLTALCRRAGKPVIIATQMLQSMITSPNPTRAEVSDVANAIFDGADAVMLSAETAAGQYPMLAVDVIRRVATATEAHLADRWPNLAELNRDPERPDAPSAAVTAAAARAAYELRARLVAVWTTSGNTVRLMAAQRLPIPVVGLTHDARVARRMSLYYGVRTLAMPPRTEPERIFSDLDAGLQGLGLAAPGDRVVVVTATRPGRSGGTNALLVHTVGSSTGRVPGSAEGAPARRPP